MSPLRWYRAGIGVAEYLNACRVQHFTIKLLLSSIYFELKPRESEDLFILGRGSMSNFFFGWRAAIGTAAIYFNKIYVHNYSTLMMFRSIVHRWYTHGHTDLTAAPENNTATTVWRWLVPGPPTLACVNVGTRGDIAESYLYL